MYKGRKGDASDFTMAVHIKGPREETITLLCWQNVLFGWIRKVQH